MTPAQALHRAVNDRGLMLSLPMCAELIEAVDSARWQPIETAPDNAERVILAGPSIFGGWSVFPGWIENGNLSHSWADHWMQWPNPPKENIA